MNKRHLRRTSRRLYVREQLTGYGSAADQEIPYSDLYKQFMVTERNCKPTTAKCNLDMIKEFYRFLRLEYGLDRFDPLLIEPSHVRRYLVYLNNELNNSPVTRNRKLSALGSYYLFLECTRLTRMLQAGADLMALKKLAGHKSLKTTQRYLGITQNQLREAMKKHPLR